MKFRPKGRKIYRRKTKYERIRSFKSNTSAIVVTILGVIVLVFVGYSIGGPVMRFLEDSHILSVPVEVEETIPPTETEPVTEAETAPEETQPPTDPKPEVPEIRGCMLDVSALLTQSALDEAMTRIPEGTTHVLVPLKAQGGGIYFATTMMDAAKGGAVKAAVPLENIHETIAAKGFVPVAVINTLDDMIYPQIHTEAAYHLETGEVWLDAQGHPRLSPFSEMAVDYLGNLAAEANQAGFQTILCDGLKFPNFTEEDLSKLESRVTQEGRYTALTSVIERMQREAPHTEFYVLLDGTSILANRTEGLSATESLKLTAVVMRLDEMSAANCEALRTLTEHNATLFYWDGVPLPENEHSYLIPLSQAPAAQAEEES